MKIGALKGLFLFCFVCFRGFSTAQECQWLTVAGGAAYERGYAVDVSDSNYVATAGYIFDSLTINSVKYYGPNAFVIKYDDAGNIIWLKQISGGTQYPNGNTNLIYSIAFDKQSNIYISGEYSGLADFGNGIKLNSGSQDNLKIFIVKLNSNGRTLWARDAGAFNVSSTRISKMTVDTKGDITLGFRFNRFDTMHFSGSTFVLHPLGTTLDIGVFKYNTSGIFQWAQVFGAAAVYEDFNDIGSDASDNIYVYGTSFADFYFGTQLVPDTGHVILKMSPAGTPIFGYKIKTVLSSTAAGIAVKENGSFAVSGIFMQKIDFGSGKTLTQTGTGYTNNFIAYFDETFNPVWVRKDDPVVNGSIYPYAGITYKNGNFYLGGSLMNGDTRFGSFTINWVPPQINMYVVKMDTVGNFLWAFSSGISTGGTTLYDISADQTSGCYITGGYSSYISVFNKNAPGNANEDFFAAKIIDYNIIRGNVFSGPYCAGDTIKIPYTKAGTYHIGNEFIAQLSDSTGNFTGGERELGRITDTASGVIKGLLPLFNVATTNKYRIRIISTDPPVQSFYKADTLRLLIYSKDTANAGPDITLCQGQQVRLSTTGGSKWQWSPTVYMPNIADTANRQPLVKPTASTEYRIIISDSSGCGVTDTDFVYVFVRPHLVVTAPDTVHTCKGRPATLLAKTQGGDSARYYYTWFRAGDVAKTVLSATDKVVVNPDSATSYKVIVSDSCSVNDTATVTVIPQSGLTLAPFADTTICLGNSVLFDAAAFTCDTTAVKYVWDNALGTGPVKTVSPATTTTYKILAYDTINGSKDSAFITVTVRPRLQLALTADTTICTGNILQLNALPHGGLAAGYKLQWAENHTAWTDTNFIIQVSPAQNTTYTAVLRDNCTVLPDTQRVTVTVRPPLAVTVNADTTICTGETAQLRAMVSGGFTTRHKLRWTTNNSAWTDTNYTLTVSPQGSTIYTATLTDNCTVKGDSGKVTITVRPPLQLILSPDTIICVNGIAQLTALPGGGWPAGYRLLWTDDNSTDTDTNYTRAVTPATTTTYKAVLTDNCTVLGDSGIIAVTVRPPLSISLRTTKDSICQHEEITLEAAPTGGDTAHYSWLWETNNTTWSSTANPATDTPRVTTVYTATLDDNCSPAIKDSIAITVLPLPVAGFSITPALGCPPLSVVFADSSTGNDVALNRWQVQNDIQTGIASFTYEFVLPGTYDVSLAINNALGCRDSIVKRAAVKVFEKPLAAFTVKPDIIEADKEVFLLNHSQRATGYLWDFGDGNTLAQNNAHDTLYHYTDTGLQVLLLIAENANGCKDTARQILHVHDRLSCAVPTAFTPGSRDNINDIFVPVCTGLKNYILTIYNRWGQAIFTCENCAWDGTYDGQALPADLYLYQLQITALSGKKQTFTGSVAIVR